MQLTRQIFLPLAVVSVAAAATVPPPGYGKTDIDTETQLMSTEWDAACRNKAKKFGLKVAQSLFQSDSSTLRDESASPICKLYPKGNGKGDRKPVDYSKEVLEEFEKSRSIKTDAAGNRIYK